MAAAVAGAITMTIGGYFESKKYNSGEKPSAAALTIGAGYFAGGVVTTLPYYFTTYPLDALLYSVIITLGILLIAGYWEGKLNGGRGWTNAVRVSLAGAAAAGAAFGIAKLFV